MPWLGGNHLDRIIIERINCYGYHGVLLEEQSLGQEFQVNLELGIDLSGHCEDRIDAVADYREAIAVVEEVMYGEPKQLLETLATLIATKLLKLKGITEVAVEVRKPNPPIPGVQGGISVVVTRSK
jgi:7,8-dihydroneopterin aldolase/epimerase/oxygenase